MSDFPSVPPLPISVSTYSRWAAGWECGAFLGSGLTAATLTWPVANTAIYVPMSIPWPYPVRRVFWIVGAANTATNMDFGIYTESGTKIYSTGSTAEGTVNLPQYTTPTEFLLTPGRYFFALSCSTITANCGGQGSAIATLIRQRLSGCLSQTSALPLPATMTPVALANSCMPFCGITRSLT